MNNKTLLHGLAYILGLLVVLPATASADLLALYDFEETVQPSNGQSASAFPIVSGGVSASNYNSNSSLRNVVGTTFGGLARNATDPHAFARTVTSPSDNSTNPYYHDFSLTVDNGVWSFDSLHFDYWVNDVSLADTAAGERFTATVYSDLGADPNDPLTALTTIGSVDYSPTDGEAPDTQTVTFNDTNFRDLFRDLSEGTTVEFRIAFTDNINDGEVVHRIDDVEVRGTQTAASSVSVPEPAAATILMLVAGAAMMRRRRRLSSFIENHAVLN